MADVSFTPVSSMPSSVHQVPYGTMCDSHPDILAYKRVQGETDSFGAEYVDMCHECYEAHLQYRRQEYESEQYCEWCKQLKKHCRPHRDIDEGMAGPVYTVCKDCRDKEQKALEAELEESGFYDRYIDDDEPTPAELEQERREWEERDARADQDFRQYSLEASLRRYRARSIFNP